MTQRNDKAIVTLAVGDGYTANFMANVRPTWEPYCEKHGYDLILLTEPIDRDCDFSVKSVHWQKLLIGLLPRLKEYGHIVWLDGDILINHAIAPCIVSEMNTDKIGVIDISNVFHRIDHNYNLHVRFLLLNYLFARAVDGETPKAIITDGNLPAYYRKLGFEGNTERFINTGVLVFDPDKHANFLAEVYAKYPGDFMDLENTPLSYELQANERAEYLDSRFNLIWAQVAAEHYPFLFNPQFAARRHEIARLCVNVAYRNSWFLHFAGGRKNPVIKGAFGLVDGDAAGVPEIIFPDAWPGLAEFVEFCPLEDLNEVRKKLGGAAGKYMVLF